MLNFIYAVIFRGSYLVFPILLAVLCWGVDYLGWVLSSFVVILGFIFIWMRFIEPQQLRIGISHLAGTSVQARIALVSDLHLGVYKSSAYLRRIVRALHEAAPDYVFFLGDYVMGAKDSDLPELLEALKDLNIPSFAIWGNHDYEQRDLLAPIFAEAGIQVLHNQQKDMGDWVLVALGSDRHGDDDVSVLQQVTKPALILAHEPTTAEKIQGSYVVFSGHTHGGQIRLPWLTRLVLNWNYGGFDHGLVYGSYGRLFISSGLGETALPLRFCRPPQLDICELRH